MNGILVLDKPSDFTSFDVIAKLRGMLKIRRLGHTGTLDPMATGVLPVLVGTATRAMDILPIQEKEYTAEFQLGKTSDTLDVTGTILTEREFSVTRDEMEKALIPFRGEITQIPPMYSAVQKDGVRLYDLARQGIEVERKARECTIHNLELLEFDPKSGIGTLKALCSKGTYIRTLVADIGESLNCGAILTQLRRTMATGFTCEDAVTLQQAQELTNLGTLHDRILPISRAFDIYPKVTVTEKQATRFCNGGYLNLAYLTLDLKASNIFNIYSPEDEFLGLGTPDFETEEMKIFKLFGR